MLFHMKPCPKSACYRLEFYLRKNTGAQEMHSPQPGCKIFEKRNQLLDTCQDHFKNELKSGRPNVESNMGMAEDLEGNMEVDIDFKFKP